VVGKTETTPLPAVTFADGTNESIQEEKPDKHGKIILRRSEEGPISIAEGTQHLVLDGSTTVRSGVRLPTRTLQSLQTTRDTLIPLFNLLAPEFYI
jgi:hypothetical protein